MRVLFAGLMLSSVALAQAPALLGYQGRLIAADGQPVSGPVELRFSLYDAATGTTPAWEETHTVGASDGYYSLFLGSSGADAGASLEAVLASGSAHVELSVKRAADSSFSTLQPRLVQLGPGPT